MKNWLLRIPKEYWAYFALSIWGVLTFTLLHKTSYGIDEGAAQALLLVWSVTDDIVSPVVTMGFPDFRAVFFAPVGFLWTGNVVAAKVATIIVMSIVAWAFHAWRLRSGDDEGALLASGLLLISPIALDQIDTVSVAAYLLFAFVIGAWSDQIYRESQKAFGGMYFAQLFLCLLSTTLHPIGLAYPLALLWTWYKNPIDSKHRNYFFYGIGFVILLALALTSGWSHVDWFSNPIKGLSSFFGAPVNGEEFGVIRWITGIGALFILLLVIWKQASKLWANFLGRILLISVFIGMLIGDEIFGIIALTICLFWGMPLLLKKPTSVQSGFWKQRGLALSLIFIISTTFMILDKSRYQMMLTDVLSPRDNLIKVLAEDSGLFLNENSSQNTPDKKPIRVASQWPALTLLACRCDALPLPPNAQNSDDLLAMLRGVDYLMFDPHNPKNYSLSHNLATIDSGKVETVALRQGGVIVQIKRQPPAQLPENKT